MLGSLNRWMTAGLAASLVLVLLLFNAWQGAKDDLAEQRAQCNADKLEAIAEAERITREATQAAAEQRIAVAAAAHAREVAALEAELDKSVQAEKRQAVRNQELRRQAEEAFNADDIPDSDACLNAFITSRALRCVLHARDQGEAGAGALRGPDVCADPEGADGVHPGFSNVTYLDALLYWGSDRDAAIRLNQRLAEIRRIEGEVIDGNAE